MFKVLTTDLTSMCKPNISLCMIVRNEQQYLAQCLRSVEGLVSEIIVVDTGSTDNSILIAKEFNAQVYKFKWENDFSKPRNFGIKKAKGDWILVLDADECLHKDSFEDLIKACSFPENCYKLTQRHYTKNTSIQGFVPCRGEFPELEENIPGYFESSLVRLFPKNPKLRYRNRIHELVEPSIFDHPEFKIIESGIRIHHFGNLKASREVSGKGELYTNLGKLKASEKPNDWKALYELGIEHNCNGRLKESVEAFDKAAKLNPKYLDLWINYGYVLCELGDFNKAVEALKIALNLNASSSEAWSNLGVVYLRVGRYLLAIEAFQAAIRFNKNYVNAWNNLGDSFLNAAMPTKAANAFENALSLVPQSEKAKEGLGIAALMLGNLSRAEKLLMSIPLTPRSEFWLMQLKRLTGNSHSEKQMSL